jgi:uncharacterized protein (TIGR02271 family)
MLVLHLAAGVLMLRQRQLFFMAPQNMQTIVGVFDAYTTAQQASNELTMAGIPAGSIHIESETKTLGAGAGEPAHAVHQGGFSGWISRLFGEDDQNESGYYSEAIERGHAVLSATVPASQVESAANILNRYGAIDVDEHTERQTAGADISGKPSLPVIEEELQLSKRAVKRGGVRVYSRVVDEPVEEKINLREEHVRVERRPVDRDVTAEDLTRLRDQTIEVTEMTEEPVVSKRARVVEEVFVGKEATERTETVRDSVRHTEVQVDELPKTDTPTTRK